MPLIVITISANQSFREHIYRSHRQPDNKCNRCCEAFTSCDLLADHQRAEIPCMVSQDRSIDGITESQYIVLRKKPVGKKNDVERWEEVYRTIFPKATVIPSPCEYTSLIASMQLLNCE